MIGILLYATSLVQLIHGAQPRTWTDQTGSYRTEAEFVAFQNGTVWLKRTDGLLLALPIERLSADDQRFVQQQTSPNSTRPKEPPSETEPKAQPAKPTPEKQGPEKQGPEKAAAEKPTAEEPTPEKQGPVERKGTPAAPKAEVKPSSPAPQERASPPAQEPVVQPKQAAPQNSLISDSLAILLRYGRWVLWASVVSVVTLLAFTVHEYRCDIRRFFRHGSLVARCLTVAAGVLLMSGAILMGFLWGGRNDGGLAGSAAERTPAAVGGGLLLLTVIGACLARVRRRRRAELIRTTCPRCLGTGTLKYELPPEGEIELAECSHMLETSSYTECGYRSPSLYQDLTKVDISCLGHPSAGKTMWMAMAYRELNERRYPAALQFMKPKALGSDEWDALVDGIVNDRMGPTPTQIEIPHPLAFNFLDRDWAGRSNALVELFDFAGEITHNCRLGNFMRRRALKARGFLLFLDPTQASRVQSNSVFEVIEDLRLLTRTRLGQHIRVPVAVCVPKIDLLPGRLPPEQGPEIEEFYQTLGTIGWKADLASLRARSELTAGFLRVIWPDWDVRRQVADNFGRRCMFFPLTSVGMDNPGEDDLSEQIIAPLGILPPLLWLLHVNGYQCLG